jgi:hypothetical protein
MTSLICFGAAHPEQPLGPQSARGDALADHALGRAYRSPPALDPETILVETNHQRIASLEA